MAENPPGQAPDPLAPLLAEIRGCTHCAAHLPLGPRPIVRLSATARLVLISQAPGSKAHASGVPWRDDSGQRLRGWLGLEPDVFYDPARVAILPMGFCYPGASGGADLPPRPECAPLWHGKALAALPQPRLTLLIGMHAQRHYLGNARGATLTATIRQFAQYLPRYFPLPHPSWRVMGWMRRNPWFEAEVVPALRGAVGEWGAVLECPPGARGFAPSASVLGPMADSLPSPLRPEALEPLRR